MSTLNDEILREALAQLDGWDGDRHGIHRTLTISDAQHAELTERVKVLADAMRLRPVLARSDGRTDIDVRPTDGESLSTAQVTLAARIEAAYRAISGAAAAALPIPPVARPWLRWRRHRQPDTPNGALARGESTCGPDDAPATAEPAAGPDGALAPAESVASSDEKGPAGRMRPVDGSDEAG